MNHERRHWLPIGLVAAGVVGILTASLANAGRLGWWQVLIYAGCGAALAALALFRRKLSATEVELDALRRRLGDEENRLLMERSQFEQLRVAVQHELSQETDRLNKREQALSNRLVTYHEWMEFPQPLDLRHTALDDARLADLAAKDRQLNELLKAETRTLYDSILANKYAPDGRVLLPVIRDDIVSLVLRAARIYQPDVEHPFVDASLTRVFRAISRASLQMLVVLDELPVDIKHASLSKLYGYVRTAVTTWRMYKSTEPYWPYVNTAYYLGRFALGANPLALGTWWFVGNLGSRGAQAIAQHMINRQALTMLSSLVRVIGYEVATIYGGDFRHRDANWIYATELTELVSEFPLSRDSLAHALREVGSLELRSEYDRIFLYRCLASGKSAGPGRFAAAAILTIDERRAVATRLERFLEAFVHGKSADKVRQWKEGAEGRLGMKISVAMKATTASVEEQITDGLRSLASFLVSTKQLEPPEAVKLLENTALLHQLSADARNSLLASLPETASFFFEHPDLDPDSDLADKYLDDLAALNARTPPRAMAIEETLEDVAVYLRRTTRQMRDLLQKQYAAALAEQLPAEFSLKSRLPAAVSRAALDLLVDPTQRARFLYGPVKLEWPDEKASLPAMDGAPWLLGVGNRLLLFTAGTQPRVVWRSSAADVQVECTRLLLATSCVLTGGEWQLAAAARPNAIRISGALLSTYGSYFDPLLNMLGRPSGSKPAVAG